MGERTKTGNVLIDAWFDALAPLLPAESSASAFPWEGMFFGSSQAGAGVASAMNALPIARVAELWSDLAQRAFGVTAAMGSAKNAGDPMGEALERSFGVLGDAVGTSADAPAVLAETVKSASLLLSARESYRIFMLATWQRAFEEITREAARRTSEGRPPATPAQWLALSNEAADRVFVAAFHSEAYVQAQSALARALADQRRSETKLIELFAQFGHFPTRRAFDELGKEVNDLQRRVRRLERAGRATEAERSAQDRGGR